MEEKKETTIDKQKRVNPKLIVILIIALILMVIGIYVLYFQNNKRVIGKAIDNIKNDTEKYFSPKNSDQNVGDNYTSETDFKFNIESEYLSAYLLSSPEVAPFAKMIENLSKTENKITVKQDKANKKAYFDIDSKLNNESLFKMKYLIENNTEYYYIEDFLDQYINNGTSNYFESLTSSDTSKENIEYVYEFAISSFKRNLDNSYFSKKGEKVKTNGKEKTLQKVTLELDNGRLVELADKILKDLKNDKKANRILTGIDDDFKNAKVNKKETILNNDEKLIFSVYAHNITYQIEKYHLEYKVGNDSYILTYEKGNQDIIEIKENDTNLFSATITEKDEKLIADLIYQNKNIGTAEISNKQNQYSLKINLNIEGIKMNMDTQLESKEVKKNQSYNTDSKVSMKIEADQQTLAKVDISAKTKLTKGAKIKENTDNVVFAKELNNTEEEKLKQVFTNIFMKLMS